METCDYEDDAMYCALEPNHSDEHRFLYVFDNEDEGTIYRLLTHAEYAEIVGDDDE